MSNPADLYGYPQPSVTTPVNPADQYGFPQATVETPEPGILSGEFWGNLVDEIFTKQNVYALGEGLAGTEGTLQMALRAGMLGNMYGGNQGYRIAPQPIYPIQGGGNDYLAQQGLQLIQPPISKLQMFL